MLTDNNIVSPNEAQKEDLLLVHSKQYLDSLKVIRM
jgi:acetoin utilization deacetylase AcuC-like enzyme